MPRVHCLPTAVLFFAGVILAGRADPVCAQTEIPTVRTAQVLERQNMASGKVFVGTVEPRRRAAIGAAVGGRVVEFLVSEGEPVQAKQPLARLLTKNLDIQIAAARAEWDLRKQELAELKNGAREEEKLQAESRLKAAEAARKLAQAKLARTKELRLRNAATPGELDDDITATDLAENNYLVAKATRDLIFAGPRSEKIAQAQARVDSAFEEINRLQDLLDKHTITTPFAGVVVAEHTEVGQWIDPGKLVAEVVEVEHVEVRVPVLESYISRLSLRTSARIDVDAVPHETFVGTVAAIVPQADEKSRSFPVKIRVSNPRQDDGTYLLKPGMFARVWLPVDKKTQVLLVPKDSLVLGGPQPIVFVVDAAAKKTDKPKVRAVPVQLGIAADSWIEVRGELRAGQTVVVEGNERLRPGIEVVATPIELKPPSDSGTQPPAKVSDHPVKVLDSPAPTGRGDG